MRNNKRRACKDNNFSEELGTRKEKVKKSSKEELSFSQSRKEDLQGLVKDGTFEVTKEKEIAASTRVLGSRFAD